MKIKDHFWTAWRDSWLFPEQLEKWTIRKAILGITGERSGILLDVGCGAKPYLEILEDKVALYIGVEYPPSDNQGTSRPDIYGSGTSLPVKSEAVDIVLSTQVLEHLPDSYAFFREVFRALKAGGRLYLTTNQEWGIHKAPYDFFRFTRYGLERLCESSGLRCLKIENRGGFWIMMGQRLSAYIFDRWVGRFRRDHKVVFAVAFAVTAPVIPIIQLVSILMDRVDYVDTNTIGYFMEAEKPASPQ